MCLAQIFEEECKRIYDCCNTNYPCPDMFTALIDIDNSIFCPLLESYKNLVNWKLPTIALVLESPHICEYNSNGLPIGPAQGVTGRNIQLHLMNHLKKMSLEGPYKLLLVEAIPFQCSNGNPLRQGNYSQKRDELFKAIWNNGGKEFLVERMNEYAPNVIINSCTGGVSKINSGCTLNSLVQKSIETMSPANGKFYSPHPSSVHFAKCFKKI